MTEGNEPSREEIIEHLADSILQTEGWIREVRRDLEEAKRDGVVLEEASTLAGLTALLTCQTVLTREWEFAAGQTWEPAAT